MYIKPAFLRAKESSVAFLAHSTQPMWAPLWCNDFRHAQSQRLKTSFTNISQNPFPSSRMSQEQAWTNSAQHHGWPLSFHSQLHIPYRLCFNVFGHTFVSVCLFPFACMFLNDVAAMYKDSQCLSWINHPVLLYSFCVLPQLFKLFTPLLACSLSSTFTPSFFVHCRPS